MTSSYEKTVYQDFDVEDVLSQLNLDEKVSLLAGKDAWHTAAIPRLGVPSIRVTDGPNGVRGIKFFNSVPAACLPCGTALAATWDANLVAEGAQLQGREAIAKGASVILGPTTNMQRSPLGGRGFESFSEDPVLAGNMSAATVNGIQSTGVAATLKHYVCNDGEDKRQLVDAILTERALREIYLMPFQIAQRDAQPRAIMTSYNRVNGTHVSEDPRLLRTILRDEWGFGGLLMSDWLGTYSTTEAVKAGLDLEMPGPAKLRGSQVDVALQCGKLTAKDVEQCAANVLNLVKKSLPLGIPQDAPESTVNSPETSALLRHIASSSVVLLKNENQVLPFTKSKTLAVIGPNAAITAYCGGGSAALKPYYAISPLEGIQAQYPDAKYSLGVPAWKRLPELSLLSKAHSGERGLDIKFFLDPPSKGDRVPLEEVYTSSSDVFMVDYRHPKVSNDIFWADLECTMTPDESGEYEFSITVAGTGKLYVDSQEVVDNETVQSPGDSFFGAGTGEVVGSTTLEQGREYKILVRFATLPMQTCKRPGTTPFGAGGIRLGCHKKVDRQTALEAAVALAKEVDQVVVCAGLNKEWESEGYDREHMSLPPGSDELISAIAAVNPKTAVVMQSGTPVTMPWLKNVPAVVQAWYGGNETGHAIADVVLGEVNPSGKLSLSFPVRNEDNPAFLNYKSEGGRTLYGEDVYIGYRYYEKTKRAVNFPFGHGLSYTTFEMTDLSILEADGDLVVNVTVHNTGDRDGAQVVQVYVSQQKPAINRPVKELKGFTKVAVKTGESAPATVKVSKKYACSYWDEDRDAWIMEAGTYTVLVGDSSADTTLTAEFVVDKTSWWKGL